MAGDLLSGRYALTSAFSKGLGAPSGGATPSNAVSPNFAPRSNAEPGFVIPGLGSAQDAAAALVSGEMTLIACPVELGDQYSYVDVLIGATAAGTPTHQWAAIFNAAGVNVGQSVDSTTAAIAASGKLSFTLTTPYVPTLTDAPGGFVYVGVSVTALTVPSLVCGTVPTAVQYEKYSNDPAYYAGTIGSALAGSIPTSETLSGATKIAAVPVVFLR